MKHYSGLARPLHSDPSTADSIREQVFVCADMIHNMGAFIEGAIAADGGVSCVRPFKFCASYRLFAEKYDAVRAVGVWICTLSIYDGIHLHARSR